MRNQFPSRATTTLLTGLVLLAATTIFAQQAAVPTKNDATTARLICEIISRYHIGRADIDDSISKRLLDKYLKQLDSQKLYFTQEDINQFQKYETTLDDAVKEGDVSFAYEVFDLYLKRLGQRTELANQLIDGDHDFTIDEEMYVDGDDVNWAKDENEIKERWRKRIKYDILSLTLDGTKKEEVKERLHTRYNSIENSMKQTEKIEKLETFLTSLTHCFDPHSTYMSPQTLENFRISMELKLEGIGAALRWKDGYTVVDQIVPGGAADKDGRLEVGDTIMGVGQETGEIIDVVQLKLMKVVSYIRGKQGTVVRLQVKKEGSDEMVVYNLTRQTIELKEQAVKGKVINTGDRLKGTNARIGIINVPSFYRDFRGAEAGTDDFKSTVRDVAKVIKDFSDQGNIDGIVIDLRFNGGGALKEAIDVSGLFIDKGPVVMVKDPEEDIRVHSDEIEGVYYSGPIVVLCNRLSASASEIFAGAIKDYGRGIIIGDTTTHGKGTVQNIIPVSGPFRFFANQQLGSLKLTISQFYRVNGASTQNKGVESDVVLPSILDYSDFGESFLDYALPFDKVDETDHQNFNMVSNNMIQQIQQNSQKRVQGNEEFQKLSKDIEKFKKKKERKTISLNENVLRAERELDKKVEEGEDEETKTKDEDIFPVSAYNDEVLAVTIDYINLLKQQRTARNN